MNEKKAWRERGKTIKQLIEELQSFENQDLEVRVSFDDGDTHGLIYLLGKLDGCCILFGELPAAGIRGGENPG
jgi:hypothetical protein